MSSLLAFHVTLLSSSSATPSSSLQDLSLRLLPSKLILFRPCFLAVQRPPPRRFLRSTRRSGGLLCCCSSADGNANGSSSGEAVTPGNSNTIITKSRRDLLLEYVKTVQPEFMELFVKRAPQQVVDAMRQTVTNMLGTLPPQFFVVTVSTVAENLAQLMYSVLMTGYMFRNAQFRVELQKSLSQAALPSHKTVKSDPNYAPGVQKKVSGEVIRWNNDIGPETMDAAQYIELLEAEIDGLQEQLEKSNIVGNGWNELLDYLKSLEPQNLQALTTTIGEDAVEAMNTFIQRLLGMSDPEQMKRTATETTTGELAKLLYWLMVVGYSVRNIEVRYDMEKVLGMPVKLAELPPGEKM